MSVMEAEATRAEDPEELLLAEADETDAPHARLDSDSGTVDQVKDYLQLISKVRLLTAEQEVDLSKRIEAGLYAEHLLTEEPAPEPHSRRELALLAEDGRRAKNHFAEANLRLVVSVAKRYTGRGLQFLDLIQEGRGRPGDVVRVTVVRVTRTADRAARRVRGRRACGCPVPAHPLITSAA